jgi:hypothetical protein
MGQFGFGSPIGFAGSFGGEGFIGGPTKPVRIASSTSRTKDLPILSGQDKDAAPAPVQEVSDRKAAVIDRLCTILVKFAQNEVPEDVAGRIFWSYVDDAKIPPSLAAQLVLDQCPDLKIPGKPVTPAKELKKPEKEGFHGKTQITFEEAADLLELMDTVLAPLTPEEAASQIADRECLRELNDAGGFPLVERLQERLRKFLETASPDALFTISQGETVVTGKAVECAEALGRIKTIKTVATVGGIAAGGGILLLLFGLI